MTWLAVGTKGKNEKSSKILFNIEFKLTSDFVQIGLKITFEQNFAQILTGCSWENQRMLKWKIFFATFMVLVYF